MAVFEFTETHRTLQPDKLDGFGRVSVRRCSSCIKGASAVKHLSMKLAQHMIAGIAESTRNRNIANVNARTDMTDMTDSISELICGGRLAELLECVVSHGN